MRKRKEAGNLPATPEETAQTVFMGRPKPKSEWRYLKRDHREKPGSGDR